MPSRGQTITIQFVAWDTSANAGKTGDVANFTLRWVKDGVSAAPTNAAAEVDATNAPGVYSLTLTAAECTCNCGTLSGKSSTANIAIVPLTVTFEQLPTAAPAASGGLPTVDAANGVKVSVGTGAGQVNAASGKVPATLASTDVTGSVAADLQTIKAQAVTCPAAVTVGPFVGNATAALAVDASGRVDLGKILGTASAGVAGHVGIDWSHVNAPTTAVALTGTTISTGQAVASVTGDVGGNVGGSVLGTVTLAASQPNYAPAKAGNSMTLTTAERTTLTGLIWGDTADFTAPPAGSAAAKLNAAGAVGDPWATALPGSYTSGQAGYILGHNLDAAITSRLAAASAPANFAELQIAGGPAAPAAPVPTTAATGGSVADGTYRVVVSYLNDLGESVGSAEGSVAAAGGGTSTLTIPSPPANSQSLAWKAYVGTAPGGPYYLQPGPLAGGANAIGTPLVLTQPPAATGNNPLATSTAAGGVAIDRMRPIVFRDQRNLATPVGADADMAAWQYAFGAEAADGSNTDAKDPSGNIIYVYTAASETVVKLAPDGLDDITIESGVNARQALSPILAAAAGALSGAGTGTIVIKGGNVSATRITASTDSVGNRTAITLNLPA